MYYIQCMTRTCGGIVWWWGENFIGYTPVLDKAGLYTLEQAEKVKSNADDVKIWKQETVECAKVNAVLESNLYKF